MDINCVVCGEPWESYVIETDIPPWQKKLFKEGAGCPGCKGEPPNGKQWQPTSVFDIENGDEDPMDRLNAHEDFENRPKWERPDDIVYWKCAGCGVEVHGNVDWDEKSEFYLDYHVPLNSNARHWWASHSTRNLEPTKEPAHIFYKDTNDPQPVCENCLDHCSDCGTEICSFIEHDDCYGDGYSMRLEDDHYGNDCRCVSCWDENICIDCQAPYDDGCECGSDEEEEDDEC